MAEAPASGTAIVVGDDRTDEDMFDAAGSEALTVKVGGGKSSARFRLADCRSTRRWLGSLLATERVEG